MLAPLDAAAVVIWVLEADGSLSLLGEAGLSGAEASHWRRVPPQLDFPAQRVARGGPDLWWNAGRPEADGVPVIGAPGAASAVLALRERTGELLGVMTVDLAGAARGISAPRSGSTCRPSPRAARGS